MSPANSTATWVKAENAFILDTNTSILFPIKALIEVHQENWRRMCQVGDRHHGQWDTGHRHLGEHSPPRGMLGTQVQSEKSKRQNPAGATTP